MRQAGASSHAIQQMERYSEAATEFVALNAADVSQISPLATLVSGGVAGTVYWFSLYPFDVIKNRIMVRIPSEALSWPPRHFARDTTLLRLTCLIGCA